MKPLYLSGLLVAVALLVFSRTRAGKSTVSAIVDTVGSVARGVRNNNPGNIRHGEKWQGLSTVQSDPAFAQFQSMQYGIRAMSKVLRTYQTRYGLDNIREIIARWAPPSENDTGSYVASVARETGIQPEYSIDTQNADTMFALVRAIIRHENGIAASLLISDATVREGIALA